MKYLCLVYFEEQAIDGMSTSEFDSCRRDSLAYMDELDSSGHLVVCNALQRVRTATSLRMRNGRLSITDGPFAETKEQLGGFMLLEANDLNEAVQLAAKMPLAQLGSIEVRPTWELAQKEPTAGRDVPAKGNIEAAQ